MKLFSKKELSDKISDQHNQTLVESIRLQRITREEIKKNNEIIANVDNDKSKILNEFNNFISSISFKKQNILKEIIALEKKRELLLQPIDNLKIELIEKQEDLNEYEKRLEEKKKILIKIQNNNIERSILLKNKEKELIDRELGIIESEKVIKKQSEILGNKIKTFIEDSEATSNNLNKLKIEIKAEFERVSDTEKLNKVTTTVIAEEWKKIKNEWKKIKDERQAFLRAKTEILK